MNMTILTSIEGWLLLAAFGLISFALAWTSRRGEAKSKTEFLLVDRTVGWRRGSLSIAATWIWAPALFIAAQQGYEHGWVGVFWFTVPNVACLILFGWFAQRARVIFPNGYTASDTARQGYSNRVQRMYLIALTGLAVCAFAVQLLAGGLVLSTLTGIPFMVITVALTLIALSYSLHHGLNSSIITDYVQMWVLVLVGVGLAVWVAVEAGAGTILDGMHGVGGDYTSLTSGPGAALFWSFGLSTSIGLLSGPFGDQSFWQRTWAAKDGQVFRSFAVGAAAFSIIPLSMALLGFAAAGAGLTISNPQLTNLESVLNWLPAWVVYPFLLYVFAGLISTLSSVLNAVASLSGHDLTALPTDAIRNARRGMIALSILGLGIANVPGLMIVQLFIFYGTLRASTLLPTVLMLASRRRLSEAGAFYGIITALIVGLPLSAYGNLNMVVPLIWGSSVAVIVLSGGGVIVGTLIERVRGVQHDEIVEESDAGLVSGNPA